MKRYTILFLLIGLIFHLKGETWLWIILFIAIDIFNIGWEMRKEQETRDSLIKFIKGSSPDNNGSIPKFPDDRVEKCERLR